MRLVPDDYRKRFFKQDGEVWQAQAPLTRWTRFEQHNLMEPLRSAAFDLVVVKNVLIYFDEESKAVVMGHVKNAVKPDGLLLTGAAEGIARLLDDYERIHGWLHKKPASGTRGK